MKLEIYRNDELFFEFDLRDPDITGFERAEERILYRDLIIQHTLKSSSRILGNIKNKIVYIALKSKIDENFEDYQKEDRPDKAAVKNSRGKRGGSKGRSKPIHGLDGKGGKV